MSPQLSLITSAVDVLMDAIETRDVEKAKSLLAKTGPDPNDPSKTKNLSIDEIRSGFARRQLCNAIEKIDELDERHKAPFYSVWFELVDKRIIEIMLSFIGDKEERFAVLLLDNSTDLLLHKENQNGITLLKSAVEKNSVEVTSRILSWATENDFQDLVIPKTKRVGNSDFEDEDLRQCSVLEIAAAKGHQGIVEMLVDFNRELLNHGLPLHAAVAGDNVIVVEYLLERKSDLLETTTPAPAAESALFYQGGKQSNRLRPNSKMIKNLIVERIIRGTRSAALVRKLLRGPDESEICLDLSIFSQTTHKFHLFVDGLVRKQGPLVLRFHPILSYVEFPYLSPSYPNDWPTVIGPEVQKVLKWLSGHKGVTKIFRLRVPGSTPRTESEEFVGKALRKISVIQLDWGVLDLSIDILLGCGAKDVEVLHLYSSGNRGVLQQWSGDEGVKLLKKLTYLKDMVSEASAEESLNMLRLRLAPDEQGNIQRKPGPIHVQLHVDEWKSSGLPLSSRMGLDGLQETTYTITKLKNFHDFYAGCNKTRGDDQRIKVAVIDTGVDGTLSTLSECILDGVSLVEDFEGRESPWWLASHPHGTQMASFIHQLDPFCYLYVIKICDEYGGVHGDTLAQAIRKAIEREVDIISMSIAVPRNTEQLIQAAGSARAKDIVMVASRGDRGGNQEQIWPADTDGVISISSLTNFGKQADSTELSAKYYFQGENVSIPAESTYLESQKIASGSSVATALAAGVAALSLSCRRLVREKFPGGGNEDNEQIDRVRTVKAVFDGMTGNDEDRYVKPWKVFQDRKMEPVDGLDWLKGKFGKNQDFWHNRPS